MELLNLDSNWAMSVVALCAQEIAIRKKLEDMGDSPGELDFQKVAETLEKRLRDSGLDPPNVLLSLARAYPRIRGKLVHWGHIGQVYDGDVDGIIANTIGLVETLFLSMKASENMSHVADALLGVNDEKFASKIGELIPEQKRKVTLALIERLSSLDWNQPGYFDTKRKTEEAVKSIARSLDPDDLTTLLDTAIQRFGVSQPSLVMRMVGETCHHTTVMRFLQKRNYADWIVSRFVNSNSYDEASVNAKVVANIASILSTSQIQQILGAASENSQIRDSWGARSYLKDFIALHGRKSRREISKKGGMPPKKA